MRLSACQYFIDSHAGLCHAFAYQMGRRSMTQIRATRREVERLTAVYGPALVRRREERERARAWYVASMRKVRRAMRNQRLGVL